MMKQAQFSWFGEQTELKEQQKNRDCEVNPNKAVNTSSKEATEFQNTEKAKVKVQMKNKPSN